MLTQGVYDLAWRLALPLVLARFWWRGRREPDYRLDWAQRLGFWPAEGSAPDHPRQPLIWLHAVSLGETRAAAPLIQALRQRHADMRLLLTTGTATGRAAGRALLRPGDLHGWVPLDTPGAVRRFLQGLRPGLAIIMETETWPNLLAVAEQEGVPVVLANARLSERSLAKGRRHPRLMRPMMRRLSAVLAQTPADAERFIESGVPPERVQVLGQLKYDIVPPAALVRQGRQWREALQRVAPGRRIVVAASWREGEDEGLLSAWKRLRADNTPSQALLVLVPRHPQRFNEVADLVREQGLTLARRSEVDLIARPLPPEVEVWLGDSLGEMPAYYAMADIALLGGSFAPLGGQNLIEAAACACPLIAGPHTFNFADAAQAAIEAGAAWRAPDLPAAIEQALTRPQAALAEASDRALAHAARHAGASVAMADRIERWWPRG